MHLGPDHSLKRPDFANSILVKCVPNCIDKGGWKMLDYLFKIFGSL